MEIKSFKEWREEHGYTTKFIANKLGISVYTYRLKENGKKDFNLLQKQALCELYGIESSQVKKV